MRRPRRAGTRPRFLAIYLNDHLAGATGGVNLAKRSASSHHDAKLQELAEEIAEDRRTLLHIMHTLGVRPTRYKPFAAWLAERAGSMKTNGRLVRRSPLSGLIELEALQMGIHGKIACWRTLLALSDRVSELNPSLLRELLGRAHAQLHVVEQMHSDLAHKLSSR
ncbi:hypothetical protein [Saccharopolyspora hordei]|uniref:DUF2383 domain-containing protein n=1 Tax=Saccharopolyspora hordei TaxID=1838 RepID=A0A853ALT8_9PSEU|nr:hypothetical protein [Saccharopolyspora hordei]NYI84009.1 hypothetical protein [Saccharopolyspora hordei]